MGFKVAIFVVIVLLVVRSGAFKKVTMAIAQSPFSKEFAWPCS